MSIYDTAVKTLDGNDATLHDYEGDVVLIVNVASKCGLTPQYAELETLEQRYGSKGFHVLGFPCNQFGGQEPGTEGEIAEFCSTTYGVSFPMFSKIDVNGQARHPLYAALTETRDAGGEAGDVAWNFEKFLVGRDGSVLARICPPVTPLDDQVTSVIEKALVV